jgi:type IV fimbrial biogenesis protein FimT
MKNKKNKGIGLTELMYGITIMGALLMITVPSYLEFVDRYRVRTATEKMFMDLLLAKSEAAKRNTSIRITYKISPSGKKWCYGLHPVTVCDCNIPGSCSLGVNDDTQHDNIALEPHLSSPGNQLTFSSIGWDSEAKYGHVRLISRNGMQTRIIVSKNTKLRMCSPNGENYVIGYSSNC